MFRNGQKTIIVGLMAGLILFFAFNEYLSSHSAVMWYAALIAVSALRILHTVIWRFSHFDQFSIQHTRLYFLGTFLAGIVWASTVFLYTDQLPLSLQLLILIALVGIPAGSLATNSIYFPMFVLFALPQTIALVYWSAFLSPDLPLHFTLSALAYSALLYATAFKLSQNLRERIKNTLDNERPLKELTHKNQELLNLAYFDSLTCIYNRRYFIENIEDRLKANEKNPDYKGMIFMLLDLDKFKEINDTLGHLAGDFYLVETANRIKQYMEKKRDSLYARLGGDEFIIAYPDTQETHIEQEAHQLLHLLSTPIIFEEQDIKPSLSIGISEYPVDGQTLSELLKSADLAMYKAKSTGKDFYIYNDSSNEENVAHTLN